MASLLPAGMGVLDRLRDEGLIADDQYQLAISFARTNQESAEEAILQTGAITELELLKKLAAWNGTQYVSTDKLSKAAVDAYALKLVPIAIAKRFSLCPLIWDLKQRILTVVARDPMGDTVRAQVEMVASGVRQVNVLVARPAAIECLIQKSYQGDTRAFAGLIRDKKSSGQQFEDFRTGSFHLQPTKVAPPAVLQSAPPAPSFVIDAPELVASLSATKSEPARRELSMPPQANAAADDASEAYLQVIESLVGILEQEREDLRGHSARVARLCGQIAERMGQNAASVRAARLAGQLHDVGKAGTYHLTPLNVARYDGHRTQAEKSHRAAAQLFDNAPQLSAALQATTAMYERWTGAGFPNHLAGADIPILARVLSVADTFADLTTNPKNPYRRVLSPSEACSVIDGLAGELFDSTVAGALKQVLLQSDTREHLSQSQVVLLCDPDPETSAALDIRFAAAGFRVRAVRTLADAMRSLEGVAAVVSETDIDSPDDGFELLETVLRKSDPPSFIFLSTRADGKAVTRGFDAGAADYLMKPTSPDAVVAKTRQLLSRTAMRGISGSLREMSLPDVIQVLSNAKKSGKLVIRSNQGQGEILFVDGAVWDARFGTQRAEEAVYQLLQLSEGEFGLDPSHQVADRRILVATESLLLEGMRRLDESAR